MSALIVFEVVEKNCEVAHADLIHCVELANQFAKIFVALVAFVVEVETGAYGEDKAHVVFVRDGNQPLEFGELVGGIRFAPLVAVIGVVLRRVDVGIQIILAAEVDNICAVGESPGCAVKTFDDAAQGNRYCRRRAAEKYRRQQNQC